MEIFFGPAWPTPDRRAYARFLSQNGYNFYIYGPKADTHLRKHWAEPWPANYVQELRTTAAEYRKNGVKFGVALSPFGLHEALNAKSAALLKGKVELLTEIGIELLGIFFDDMPNSGGLANRQIEVLNIVRSHSSIPLLFCPTFYSFDPILDRVFGQRSSDYLYELGESVPADIGILWTGPKVISNEISRDHLADVAAILRRKPFICDNIFANDGPKNCKYIKLRNPDGRSSTSLEGASHWAFNPMNQPELSKLVLMAAKSALQENCTVEDRLCTAWDSTCSKGFAAWLRDHRDLLRNTGLDGMSNRQNGIMIEALRGFNDLAALELIEWLHGKYNVGSECLTD